MNLPLLVVAFRSGHRASGLPGLPGIFSAFLWLASLLAALPVRAHVGSPHIIFEGKAGSFPVRVVVRQPDVVPGLAEISVRVLAGSPTRVTVLPLHAGSGRGAAPRADVAVPVPGGQGLYQAALWFMVRGAYGVEVAVEGESGGSLLVPVNSVATVQRPLPKWLGWVLGGLGLGLVGALAGIAAGAVRESTLAPGIAIDGRRRLRGWIGGTLATGIAVLAVWGGSRWWEATDLHHRTRVLFQPMGHSVAVVVAEGVPTLRFDITDRRAGSPGYALIPDHGKLLHLFLVGEGRAGAIPAFAHLHPVAEGGKSYTAALPPLPEGRYRLYADITHEGGLTETVTNSVDIVAGASSKIWAPSDPDDSLLAATVPAPADDPTIELVPATFRVGEPASLRALVRSRDGRPAMLQPYLRMLGHGVVEHEDGSVFAHVHPAGTLSMAAARRFAIKAGGDAAARTVDANCGDLTAVTPAVAEALTRGGEVSFPFVFPKPGRYRVWTQVRVGGAVRTGAFQVTVADDAVAAR